MRQGGTRAKRGESEREEKAIGRENVCREGRSGRVGRNEVGEERMNVRKGRDNEEGMRDNKQNGLKSVTKSWEQYNIHPWCIVTSERGEEREKEPKGLKC